jgi:hypothetical protein
LASLAITRTHSTIELDVPTTLVLCHSLILGLACIADSAKTSSAPRGPNMIAQGIALGSRKRSNAILFALKGQYKIAAGNCFWCPFRACENRETRSRRVPRALPWAMMFGPFGAEQGFRHRRLHERGLPENQAVTGH